MEQMMEWMTLPVQQQLRQEWQHRQPARCQPTQIRPTHNSKQQQQQQQQPQEKARSRWHQKYHSSKFQPTDRSEEHTSELQSLMRISYAVFCLKKKITIYKSKPKHNTSKNKKTT